MIRAGLDLALALPQALWISSTIMRLPEAAGPRAGVVGQGPDLRLLILGDSAAAGVGVETQDRALSGQIAQRLCPHLRLTWRLFAKSGATTASCLASLRQSGLRDWPAVLLVIGVNDVKNGVRLSAWIRDLQALLKMLEEETGATRIYVSGLPPIDQFPALPGALARVLGARRDRFEAILQDLVAENPATRFLPMDFDLDASHLSIDRFHPGPDIYAAWAEKLACMLADDRRLLLGEAATSAVQE